jgi:hypothetical protein
MYRLYVKLPDSKRFSPVDWNTGTLVTNLIYATLFTEQEKAHLIANDLAHPDNAHITFEFRRAS